ncbi:MAG: cytochrome c biogenesis protein CcsA [Bdellovibrionales bacterium]|nr:cytochrome c biogenesis protein CcsA [Bdellovibrionales bacterium]
MKSSKLMFAVLATLIQIPSLAYADDPPAPLKGVSMRDVRMIPVQSGGRIKPFDEFARELILTFTGNRSYGNYDPSELMISMMVKPQDWSNVELIRVGNEDTRRQLLLDPNRKFFTPNELSKNHAFLQYADTMGPGSEGNQVTAGGVSAVTAAMDPRAEEMKRVVDRMTRFQALIGGQLWMTTPPKDGNPESPWAPLARGMEEPSQTSNAVYSMLKNYLDKDADAFNKSAAQTRALIEGATPQFDQHKSELVAEAYYNRLRPFFQALWFYLIAGILWMFAAPPEQKKVSFVRLMAKSLTFVALALHIVGFSLRCYVAGRPPVTNMYESIIWVSLGVMVFALIIYMRTHQRILISTAALLSGLALFAADSAPLLMDPTIRPLVPVLRSNYWLTIHVLTITASYAAFMLAMGISNITLFQFLKQARASAGEARTAISQKIATLNQLNYRAIMFGTVLIAAGTILGGIWADYSWGRFWGWDPKEVWALITLLVYIAILHGRYAGWVGTFAFPLWTVICFSSVIMAWYGVNFVLGVGLHSYGFSSGGQSTMTAFVVLQLIYCLYVAYQVKGLKGKPQPPATV